MIGSTCMMSDGRSPHGERGLKCLRIARLRLVPRSLPSRGAWIEITTQKKSYRAAKVAPLTGSVD